jgi:flagellar hook-length control protein FliK
MEEIVRICPQPIKLPGTTQAEPMEESIEGSLFAAMLLQLLTPPCQQDHGVPAEEISLNGSASQALRDTTPVTPPLLEVDRQTEPDRPQETEVDTTASPPRQPLSPKLEAPLHTSPGTVIVHDPPMVLSPEALLYGQPTKVEVTSTEKGDLNQSRPEPSFQGQVSVFARQASPSTVVTKIERPPNREPVKIRLVPDDKPRPVRLVERALRGSDGRMARPRETVDPPLTKSLPGKTGPTLAGLKEVKVIFDSSALIDHDGQEVALEPLGQIITAGLEPAPSLVDESPAEPLPMPREPVVPLQEEAHWPIFEEASMASPKTVPLESIPLELSIEKDLPEDLEVQEIESQGEQSFKDWTTDKARPNAKVDLASAKEPPRTAEPIQKTKPSEEMMPREPVRERKPVPSPDTVAEAGKTEPKIDQGDVSYRMVEQSLPPESQGAKPLEGMPRDVSREAPVEKGVVEQVVRHMDLEIRPGIQEVQIRLEPRELGDVRLRIISHEGAITARFAVETPSVKAIMENAMPQLRTNLQQQGIQLVDFSVQVGTSGFGFDQASPQHRERNWTHGGKRGGPSKEPAYIQSDGGWQLGRVDIRA